MSILIRRASRRLSAAIEPEDIKPLSVPELQELDETITSSSYEWLQLPKGEKGELERLLKNLDSGLWPMLVGAGFTSASDFSLNMTGMAVEISYFIYAKNFTHTSNNNAMSWLQIINTIVAGAATYHFHSDWKSMLNFGRIDGLTKGLVCASLEYEVGDTSKPFTVSSEEPDTVFVNAEIDLSKLGMQRNQKVVRILRVPLQVLTIIVAAGWNIAIVFQLHKQFSLPHGQRSFAEIVVNVILFVGKICQTCYVMQSTYLISSSCLIL